VGGASKAFLTSDFVGQSYLCYLVPVKNELFFVKLEKTNNKEQLIFCTRTCVHARDAIPLTVCTQFDPQCKNHTGTLHRICQ
jgi:hypothetical protein